MANEARGAARMAAPAPTSEPVGPALVTFIGGAEAGNVGSTSWGTDTTGKIHFPLKEPVLLDPTKAKSDTEREFMEHVIKKARNNRFYVVTDGNGGAGAQSAHVLHAEPQPRTHHNPTRGKTSPAPDRE